MLHFLRNKWPSFSFQLETSPNYIQSWQYILLGFLTFFCCYFGISSYAILDMNEGLYAEVAREMLVNKHIIIPYLNNVPYLEKPPLLYWLIALSYRLFGINDFAARVVPSTFLALSCLSVFYVGKKLQTPRVGFIGSIILLTSFVFVLMGRIVFFDMLLTFLVAGCLFSFYFWYQENKKSYLYLSYIFLGLSVLTKGFFTVGLLPLVAITFLFLMKEPKSTYKALLDKKAIIIFLIIILPWHLIAMLSFPQFTGEYLINNQILRFFNARIPHDYHTGPIYFYIPRVIAYLLPWSILLPFLFFPLKIKRPFDSLKTFLWTWFFVMLLFFSLSGDKGDYYLVIGIIPLAYLLAQKIESWFVEGKSRWLIIAFFGVILALGVAGILSLLFYQGTPADFGAQLAGDKIPIFLNGPIFLLLLTIILYGVAGIYLTRKNPGKPIIPFLFLSGLIIPVILFYITLKERTQFMYSQVALAKFIQAQYEHRDVYLYQDFEAVSSFVFYNREPSPIIDTQSSDLYFGSKTKQGKNQFISLNDFLAKAKTESLYIVMKANKLEGFEKIAGKNLFCVVQRNGTVLLLSNAQADCHATIEVGQQKEINLDDLKKLPNAKAIQNH
jgi:4-amino-4-deoxy-L-arabinose transferase-like glycosyltransferase